MSKKIRYLDLHPERHPKAALVAMWCKSCQAAFFVPRWRLRSGRGVYCSRPCAQRGAATSPAKRAYADGIRRTGTGYVKFLGRHEHRVVAERMLGRPLSRKEVVHHINGDKQDNRPENLCVMTQSEHMNIHRKDLLAGKERGAV